MKIATSIIKWLKNLFKKNKVEKSDYEKFLEDTVADQFDLMMRNRPK